jgi:hypothetical protein
LNGLFEAFENELVHGTAFACRHSLQPEMEVAGNSVDSLNL